MWTISESSWAEIHSQRAKLPFTGRETSSWNVIGESQRNVMKWDGDQMTEHSGVFFFSAVNRSGARKDLTVFHHTFPGACVDSGPRPTTVEVSASGCDAQFYIREKNTERERKKTQLWISQQTKHFSNNIPARLGGDEMIKRLQTKNKKKGAEMLLTPHKKSQTEVKPSPSVISRASGLGWKVSERKREKKWSMVVSTGPSIQAA